MNKDEIEKRITFLDTQLLEKKKLIEKELQQVEALCKEIISLKDKLEKDE